MGDWLGIAKDATARVPIGQGLQGVAAVSPGRDLIRYLLKILHLY
jgi:hypothetical protein